MVGDTSHRLDEVLKYRVRDFMMLLHVFSNFLSYNLELTNEIISFSSKMFTDVYCYYMISWALSCPHCVHKYLIGQCIVQQRKSQLMSLILAEMLLHF